jgi:hypothetical protein
MTISYLSFRTPYSAYRDCMIVIQPQGPSAYRAVCVDAATRLTIGCPSVPRAPDGRRPAISAADVIGLVGGYRMASAAVDIEMDELARQTRLIAPLCTGRRNTWNRQDPPFGVSPDEAVAAVRDVLDSIGDTCPECPPAD